MGRLRAAFPLAVALATAGFACHSEPRAAAAQSAVGLLLSSINAERSARHLRPLQLDPVLCRVARRHATDMALRNYFDHVTPEGRSPFARMTAAHYRFRYAGENLAIDGSVTSIVRDFERSREHRANLLGRHFARVGIGEVDAPVGEIVVEDFSD